MILQINKEQYKALEAEVLKRQLKKLMLTYADEINTIDPDLSHLIKIQDDDFCYVKFKNIYNLTPDRNYQKALLALLVDTGIDIFTNNEFSYILNHSFLTGSAKARHILLSATAIIIGK